MDYVHKKSMFPRNMPNIKIRKSFYSQDKPKSRRKIGMEKNFCSCVLEKFCKKTI